MARSSQIEFELRKRTAGGSPPPAWSFTMQKHLRKEKAAETKAPKGGKTKSSKADNEQKTPQAMDLRTTLEWLREQGDLIETDKEVDPDLEVTGLQKHMDGGCPVLFENV
jgi:hypothetical protein